MQAKLLFFILLLSFHNPVSAQEKKTDREAECCVGEYSFKEFLSKTIKYPLSAQEDNLQGQVVIDFIVDQNGNLKDFIPVKQFDKQCTEYAIKALKASPTWLPKMENGKPVASKQSVIIYFKLRGADTQIDIEPKDGDIIIWGYGSTKEKALTGEAHPSATSKKQ
ncbi:MAG: energy transducer TonB [Bacteroides graminisolvens]|nr:energy transducer TonB [Bacteroides graminisolvens]